MDYFGDVYFGQDDSSNDRVLYPAFVYDDRRSFSKLYVFLKLLGLIFYSSTLTTCVKTDHYFLVIIIMGLSALNGLRYEYAHYKRYGTVFLSLAEFEMWKKEQWPKSKAFFSVAELSIKIFFFIKTFPPQLEFHNLCTYGESILKIHLMVISIFYVICGVILCCIFSTFCVPPPGQPPVHRVSVSLIPIIDVINNQNEECCICLETEMIQPWSMLPCGHKFHGSCVSTWLQMHQTCPVCRLNVMTAENYVV